MSENDAINQAILCMEGIDSERDALREENVSLRRMIVGMAGRIAAQSELLTKRALKPKTPTQLLEAWVEAGNGTRLFVIQDNVVGLFDNQLNDRTLRLWVHPEPWLECTHDYAAGTEEKPATVDEMIFYALAKWAELYGTVEAT